MCNNINVVNSVQFCSRRYKNDILFLTKMTVGSAGRYLYTLVWWPSWPVSKYILNKILEECYHPLRAS